MTSAIASAERRELRRGAVETLTPLHDALAAEQAAIESAEKNAVADEKRRDAKIAAAREVLAKEWSLPDKDTAVAEIVRNAEGAIVLDADGNPIVTARLEETKVQVAGVDALERAYAMYRETLAAFVSAAHTIEFIAPDIRNAFHVLASEGVADGVSPAPLSVRTAQDDELRNLRLNGYQAVAGDL
jgi:hypothetical protein